MDTVNGLFELGGALITLLSVRQLLRDRCLRGAHWGPTIFFTVWGCWNIAYYPHLGQDLSTLGALALVAVNLLYLGQMLRFRDARPVVRIRHQVRPPVGGSGESVRSYGDRICEALDRVRERG